MDSSQTTLLIGIVIAFPVFFVTIWSFVTFLISATSGWRGMAATYRAPEGFRGTPLPSGWANRVGMASYRGVLSFEASPQGLVARVSRLFPFHPVLLLPWGALRVVRNAGVFHAGEVHVANGAVFRLNGDAFNAIEQAMAAGAQPAPGWGAAR